MTIIRQHQKARRQGVVPKPEAEGKIIETRSVDDLSQISQMEVQAVIYWPTEVSAWMGDLARAVEGGVFQIERAVLSRVSTDEIASWLDTNIPKGNLPLNLFNHFKSEILYLVDLEQALTGVSRFMFRIFTEAPTHRCGFHLDTALPRASTIGLLRVFNGAGTLYVHPENITSMRDFYRHYGLREQLGKELEKAAEDGADERYDELLREIEILDKVPGFLRDPENIHQVPDGAIVAFKHLDARLLWSDHSKGLTWIHCSPSQGPKRLVVNITTWEP